MKDKKRYCIINNFVVFFSFIAGGMTLSLSKEDILFPGFIYILLYIIIHLLCMFRLYLIFLEKKINFKRYIQVYIKTSFVNAVVLPPFGEIFRAYCYSYETGSYMWGILGIIMEQFFTASALLFITAILALWKGQISFELLILAFIVVAPVIFYWIFEPLYRYSNQFLILRTNSKRTPNILAWLEGVNSCFLHIKSLLRGRSALLLVVSCILCAIQMWFCYILEGRYVYIEPKYALGGFSKWNMVISGIMAVISYIPQILQRRWKKGEESSFNL